SRSHAVPRFTAPLLCAGDDGRIEAGEPAIAGESTMTRSIRRFLVTPLALVLAAAALAGQAAAQPRLSGLTGAVIDTQLPKKLCGNVTPVIHSAVRAVPPAGSGATCRDD